MIATILALPATGESARTVAWRQLVDIVAQAGDRLDPATCVAAHERIAELGPGVSAAERRSAAASLASRAGAQAVAIFASDAPAIAAPMLSRAQLADGEWLALIPTLPPPSRTILRNRRDLSPVVERALASYGPSDFALPAATAAVDPQSQIRNLVERIETFRRQQPAVLPVPRVDSEISLEPEAEFAPEPEAVAPATLFSFETDADGIIDWVEGAPRAALIGLSISDVAPPRAAGVDGQAAGAVRRRAPFRDARLVVAGDGVAGGEWLMVAQPVFDPKTGRFAGYHGAARRPRPEERVRRFGEAETVPLAADSLRQLVHELRTPLNAIQGFADMIDQQILGPAASAYREHARTIAGESRRLLEVVEDIDMAAKIDANRLDLHRDAVADASAVLARVTIGLKASLAERGITLAVADGGGLEVAVADVQFERMAQRLIAMVAGVAAGGETIAVSLGQAATVVTLSVSRARALTGVSERDLLDPGFGPDGEWPAAPLLGLGFSLRLIGNLARAVRGALQIDADAFTITLPRTFVQPGRAGESG